MNPLHTENGKIPNAVIEQTDKACELLGLEWDYQIDLIPDILSNSLDIKRSPIISVVWSHPSKKHNIFLDTNETSNWNSKNKLDDNSLFSLANAKLAETDLILADRAPILAQVNDIYGSLPASPYEYVKKYLDIFQNSGYLWTMDNLYKVYPSSVERLVAKTNYYLSQAVYMINFTEDEVVYYSSKLVVLNACIKRLSLGKNLIDLNVQAINGLASVSAKNGYKIDPIVEMILDIYAKLPSMPTDKVDAIQCMRNHTYANAFVFYGLQHNIHPRIIPPQTCEEDRNFYSWDMVYKTKVLS
jgi:hypothetical protein